MGGLVLELLAHRLVESALRAVAVVGTMDQKRVPGTPRTKLPASDLSQLS